VLIQPTVRKRVPVAVSLQKKIENHNLYFNVFPALLQKTRINILSSGSELWSLTCAIGQRVGLDAPKLALG